MNTYKVTYTDGTHYTTDANGTLEEFTAYLMQFGGIVTSENPVTGEETKRTIASIEQVKGDNTIDEQILTQRRLIAAAPELLEAIKEVDRILYHYLDEVHPTMAKIRAAIAKAEG